MIRSVDPGSPAQRAGLQPGETLLQVNGAKIVDDLDYKYYTYDPELELTLLEAGGGERTVRLRKEEGEQLGLNFETYLMDKARTCANHCIFCFVDQMPAGLRDTLYFKDDDARLSFLMGNYITLTNLSKREIQRIIDLRISPINVSVHTTNPELRNRMLGHRHAGDSIAVMRRFAEAGIVMNCQIVSCPGWNDGAELERTMRELAALHPGVGSVSIVPVGVTKFREGLCHLDPYTQEQAAAVVEQVEAFSTDCLNRHGSRIFWCSDEFYLLAGKPLPEDEFYENYTQLENGVGMLRLLTTEFHGAVLGLEGTETIEPFSIATGVSAAPFLDGLLHQLRAAGLTVPGRVYPIKNRFFGETIVVAGLVTGGDLIDQLRGQELGGRLLIPDAMLRHGESVFLDDVTLAQVEAELGVTVVPVPQDGFALADAILGIEPQTAEDDNCEYVMPEDEYYAYNPAKGRN